MRGRIEHPVSEAELHGFVDGGLERGRGEAVRAFLAASPDDAARVETWRRQNSRIRAAFATVKPSLPAWSLPPDTCPGRLAYAVRNGEPDTTRGGILAWRGRWSLPLAAAAFTGGVLLAAGTDYCLNHMVMSPGAPESQPQASDGAAETAASETFAAQAVSALRAFDPPSATARLSPKHGEGAPGQAAPILPALSVKGLKLAAVRAMPGEHGQMLCLFYTRASPGTLALCVEQTPGPSESDAQISGNYFSRTIAWRQKGANYALTGALPEPELRALAETVRAQVEAFGAK